MAIACVRFSRSVGGAAARLLVCPTGCAQDATRNCGPGRNANQAPPVGTGMQSLTYTTPGSNSTESTEPVKRKTEKKKIENPGYNVGAMFERKDAVPKKACKKC